VVITYTSAKSENLVKELIGQIYALDNGSAAIAVIADLRDTGAAKQIVDATLAKFDNQGIDILVNNAGCEVVKPLTDITAEDMAYVYDLNIRAPILLTKEVVPHLRAPGRIINMSSVGARAGFKELSLYCSSKAALEGLTRCWAAELGGDGHTVNAVNPGPVETELLANIPKDIVEAQRNATPVQHRVGTIDDIAQLVAWLASEESRWISGQTLSASGGWAMY
jgi:3-oxoacyl-[acyl-carrier protein] reductase